MQNLAATMNIIWSVLSILAQIISITLLVSLVFKRTPSFLTPLVSFVSRKAVFISFVASLLATIGSLIYSDVIGYDPCKLCWFQRIFMYPQVILLGLALWRKDAVIRLYALILSAIGAFIALFHYVGQLGWNPFGLECLAIGYSSSCAKNFVLQFGYITIPLMAFSAFILITLSLWHSWRKDNASGQSLNS